MDSARLVALIGPAGAGKSTWRRAWLTYRPDTTVVNLDTNRRALSCCTANQRLTPLAVEMGVATARTVLSRAGLLLWDATNAERPARQLLLVLAAEYAARTTAVVLLPPVDVVLARNATRDVTRCACGWTRRVPEPVITAMHQAITADLPGLPAEGWDEVALNPTPGDVTSCVPSRAGVVGDSCRP